MPYVQEHLFVLHFQYSNTKTYVLKYTLLILYFVKNGNFGCHGNRQKLGL
jgi:hypothetical protein